MKFKRDPIKILNGAALAKVFLYKYYSTQIIRSLAKLVLFSQVHGVRTDDSVSLFGFPMKDLPETYQREGDYPIPQIVDNIKRLATDKNRSGRYPWTVFADRHIKNDKLVQKIKQEIVRINKGVIEEALKKRVKKFAIMKKSYGDYQFKIIPPIFRYKRT